jgi:hypothetical protein
MSRRAPEISSSNSRILFDALGASGSRLGRPRFDRGCRRRPATIPAAACWESCQNRSGGISKAFAASSRIGFPSHSRRHSWARRTPSA